jgi:hypothetical protein
MTPNQPAPPARPEPGTIISDDEAEALMPRQMETLYIPGGQWYCGGCGRALALGPLKECRPHPYTLTRDAYAEGWCSELQCPRIGVHLKVPVQRRWLEVA